MGLRPPLRPLRAASARRAAGRHRGGAARDVQALRTGAAGFAGFVEAGYRAYFSFIVEDPATFAFVRRNALAAPGMEHALPLGAAELAEDLEQLDDLPALDLDYCAHAMAAVGVELGARMAAREPPDVEGATRFATGLFLAGVTRR